MYEIDFEIDKIEIDIEIDIEIESDGSVGIQAASICVCVRMCLAVLDPWVLCALPIVKHKSEIAAVFLLFELIFNLNN